eukprot:TRINITY_DN452_c1_g1_i1.p4 TRINITY_DN452_c1_g1~~TRINITY_DN452_c1_g1_i1.p4  ORF type:complete len:324 (+),score=122.55 TRINITY_DN452_c1_g1_i1:77-973(+)
MAADAETGEPGAPRGGGAAPRAVSLAEAGALVCRKQVLPALAAKPKGRGPKGRAQPAAPAPAPPAPECMLWREHPAVAFVVFGSRPELRRAAGRLSVFLEDPKDRGTVLPHPPEPQRHAAAAYSGHNCRAADCQAFAAAAAECGVELTAEERQLFALAAQLGESHGVVGLLVLSRGLDQQEARDTLQHESHHGLFYAYPELAAAAWGWWREKAAEEDRDAWRGFLAAHGYDPGHEELAVNELLAYMCTERKLLAAHGGRRGSRQQAAQRGGAGFGGDLLAMQRDFQAHIAPALPSQAR